MINRRMFYEGRGVEQTSICLHKIVMYMTREDQRVKDVRCSKNKGEVLQLHTIRRMFWRGRGVEDREESQSCVRDLLK